MNNVTSDFTRKHLSDLINSFANSKCKESKTVRLICCQPNCSSPSLHCEYQQCKSCSKSHSMCTTIQLSKWSSAIKQKLRLADDLVTRFLELEEAMIKKMIQLRKDSIKAAYFSWIPDSQVDVLTKVFIYNKFEDLRGIQAWQITEILKKTQKQRQEKQKQIFGRYVQQSSKIVESYQGIKHSSLRNLFDGLKIESSIIKDTNDENLIKKWLNDPLSVQLIYRGSQHGFKANIFHELCDNIPNTLVLVKTEFGKRIGGYTPLTWNSVNNNYSNDFSGQTFVFSLDLQQKMGLIQPQYAICCYQSYGPTFGAADIYISDDCNNNKNSSSNFPHSYNYVPKYKNGQQSYAAFSGSKSGQTFKVLEYEVFKVSWK